ncbi:MAG: ABC transporter permease, partial [bacterium]|nr:ABC transporter permease [bacterium]
MSHTSLGRKLINAPYLVWTAIFIIVPIAMVARYAFTDTNGNFTLENIYQLSRYKETFFISILYALIATFITLLISYPFAYIMSKSRIGTQKITMLLVMLPMWMNILIRTYSWMII